MGAVVVGGSGRRDEGDGCSSDLLLFQIYFFF